MGKHYSSSKAGKRYRVIPGSQGERQVKRDRNANAGKHLNAKQAANKSSTEVSRKLGDKLIIHGRKGKIIKYLNGQKPDHPVNIAKLPESGFGCAKGLIFVSPDFDEPLQEFNDYL